MSNNVLANPPGDDCVSGVQHSGDPRGKIEKIAGVDTYVAAPTEGRPVKGVILFYADVFGPLFVNNKLIQDYFATQGFVVVGIDYFEGDPIYLHNDEPQFDRPAWLAKMQARARELEPKWLDAIKDIYGRDKNYFAVGYCFGAPFVCEAGSLGIITAGAITHPAFLNEDHFRNIKVPLLLSCAEIDHTFGLDARRRAEDILVERKATYHFQVFSGIKHGFAVRGDPNVENERWAKEESARSIIGWFSRFSK